MNAFAKVREHLRMSQEGFGRLLNVNQSAVPQLERGVIVPDPRTAALLVMAARLHGMAMTFDEIYAGLLPPVRKES